MIDDLSEPNVQRGLRQVLLHERQRLLAHVQSLANAERTLGEAAREEHGVGDSDLASVTVSEQLVSTLQHADRGRLADVQAALHRLAHGAYGRCEACGGPIAVERLRAVPWTRFCIACAQKQHPPGWHARFGHAAPSLAAEHSAAR